MRTALLLAAAVLGGLASWHYLTEPWLALGILGCLASLGIALLQRSPGVRGAAVSVAAVLVAGPGHVPDTTTRYRYPFMPAVAPVTVRLLVVAPEYTPPLVTLL